jgi:hypothetical protein
MASTLLANSDAIDKCASGSYDISGVEVPIDATKSSSAVPTTSNQSEPLQQSKEMSGEGQSADTAREIGTGDLNSASPEIKYFRSYVGNADEEIEKHEVSSVGELGHSSYGVARSVSPMELIWPVKLNVDTWADFQANKDKTVPPVVSSRPYMLRINSPAIITALQETIAYWPGLDASLGSLEVVEPFMMLYHYRTELEEYTSMKLANLQSKPPGQLCERDNGLQNHMTALFQFLDNRPEAHLLKQEHQRHQADPPTSRFSTAWLLYKPGTVVFEKSEDGENMPRAYVVHSVSGGVTGSRREDLKIKLWYIDSDGFGLGRQLTEVNLAPADGELSLGSRSFLPWEMYRIKRPGEVSEEAKEARNLLIRWGKLFAEAFGRKCVDFDGMTFTSPRTKVSDRSSGGSS